ncbi:MAG TPA: hypothetical protein VGD42_15790, partial [Lysobacter sp.]
MTSGAFDACTCGCRDAGGAAAHAIVAALAQDDADLAIERGLLDRALECGACGDDCRARLREAREQRASALAARERHRARDARLQRRARERAEQRAPAPAPDQPAARPAL